MSKLITLQQIIEKEYFIICPFLATDQFISYCKDRSIETNREQLELFEKIGIFYPIARIEKPKIKKKIEYADSGVNFKDLGVLEDGEKWLGDTIEEYAHFWFEKLYAEEWLKEGILWDPTSRDFVEWSNFQDDKKQISIESYYSIFQCYTLYNLVKMTTIQSHSELWLTYNEDKLKAINNQIIDWAKNIVDICRKKGSRAEMVPILCQILSNRFFPKTQTDRRTIHLSIPSHYHNWNWHAYCRNWNSSSIMKDIGMTIDEIKNIHRMLSVDARDIDPLEHWYELVGFVALEQKRKLKGNALLAQSIYSMEHMLRLFYKDITEEELHPPNESPGWRQNYYYGTGITENGLKYLEFLTNKYHINPRPKLILVVEGNGEEEQFPRLSNDLLGYSFPNLGIEVMNLHSIDGFTGKKKIDKYGALEKFIDYYHNLQTIVYIVLDKEGRATTIRNSLLKAKSKHYPKRFVTKADYIHLWNKITIEFENFSYKEIAKAMTTICQGKYNFQHNEIEECERRLKKKMADPLSMLFLEKTGYHLDKPELLGILFGYIVDNGNNEFDSNDNPIRTVVKILDEIIRLASLNYQPTRYEIWKKNQESGYFGDINR